jgi:hypothetical protein
MKLSRVYTPSFVVSEWNKGDFVSGLFQGKIIFAPYIRGFIA